MSSVLLLVLISMSFFHDAGAQSSGYLYVCSQIDGIDCKTATQIPVCATNGIIYPSECDFIKAHCKDVILDVVTGGKCNATTAAPSNTTSMTTTKPPGLDNNSTTDMNMTMTTSMPNMNLTTTTDMSDPNMTMTTSMPTLSPLCQIVVNVACPVDNSSPVCGTDDNLYSSICEFTKAQCYNTSLQVLAAGPCPTAIPTTPSTFQILCSFITATKCTDDGIILCGSDKNTYNNSCEYEKAKCQNELLTTVSVGPC